MVSSGVWLASCLLSLLATQSWALAPNLPVATNSGSTLGRNARLSSQLYATDSAGAKDCECENSEDADALAATTQPSLVNQKGAAELFRSAVLTDADGNKIRLGDKMGEGRSVVIFLRHLG